MLLTNSGITNAIFAFIFYFCLCTLAIDSAFSIIEGVSTAISDKFKLNKKKTTLTLCIVEGIISLIYVTGAGLAILDIVDYFINSYTLILTGILEVIVAGWFFKTAKILDQVNRNTKYFKMPSWWFIPSIKVIAPTVLSGLFVWNIVNFTFDESDGRGCCPFAREQKACRFFATEANIVFGWAVILLILLSGLIIKAIVRAKAKNGFTEDEKTWDEFSDEA